MDVSWLVYVNPCRLRVLDEGDRVGAGGEVGAPPRTVPGVEAVLQDAARARVLGHERVLVGRLANRFDDDVVVVLRPT